MNCQQIFNQVAEHLLKQNERSFVGDLCMYRGENGLKCAAGCLIPEKEYHPKMERLSVMDITFFRILCDSDKEMELLSELQNMHDQNKVVKWRDDLIKIAAHWKLELPVCFQAV